MTELRNSVTNWSQKSSLRIALAFFLAALTLYVGHFIYYRYSFPVITPDEASFMSPAYDLIKKSTFSTSIHKTFLPGSDRYTYWMPPLFMMSLAAYLKVVGLSMTKAKLFSFICFSASAVVLSFISQNKLNKLWIVTLLFSCPFVLIASSTIRMEAVGFLITCLSILAVKNKYNVVVLALLTGASILTHPVFLACGASIALVVGNRRDWRQLATYVLVTGLAISPWLWYISQDPTLFQEQITLQLSRKSSVSIFTVTFSYLIQFAPLSILSLILLYKLKNRSELRLFLISAVVLITLLILKSQEFNYHLNSIPYTIAAVSLYVDEQSRARANRQLIFLVINLFFLILLGQKLRKNDFLDDSTMNELIGSLDSSHKYWNNQDILVADKFTDLTGFLMLKDQHVERVNAIAKVKDPHWEQKFNCVIDVNDRKISEPVLHAFWTAWPRPFSYQTTNKQFTITVYTRP